MLEKFPIKSPKINMRVDDENESSQNKIESRDGE